MPKRKYGYVIVIRSLDGQVFVGVEALKISPYAIDTGVGTNLDTFSDEVRPSELPNFISQMGEPDSFSFTKLTDLKSIDLQQAQIDSTSFKYASLAVISLSKVPKKLT